MCGVSLRSKSVLYKHIQDHKNPDVIWYECFVIPYTYVTNLFFAPLVKLTSGMRMILALMQFVHVMAIKNK